MNTPHLLTLTEFLEILSNRCTPIHLANENDALMVSQ